MRSEARVISFVRRRKRGLMRNYVYLKFQIQQPLAERDRERDSSCKCILQCQHLISALNAWATWAKYTTGCPCATQFPLQGCMNDLTTVRTLNRKRRRSLLCLTYFHCHVIHGRLYNQALADARLTVREFNVCIEPAYIRGMRGQLIGPISLSVDASL